MIKTGIFLIVMSTTFGKTPTYDITPMNTFNDCMKAVENSKPVMSNGDENEATIVVYCGQGVPINQWQRNWFWEQEHKAKKKHD